MNESFIKNSFIAVAMAALMLACPVFADDSNLSQEQISKLTALAEQGNSHAQALLGGLYYGGKGVPQDYSEAIKWMHKSAEQAYPEAQDALASMYAAGKGVSPDLVQAYMWSSLAVEHNNYDKGIEFYKKLKENMTSEQITEGQNLANEWIRQHSKQ